MSKMLQFQVIHVPVGIVKWTYTVEICMLNFTSYIKPECL